MIDSSDLSLRAMVQTAKLSVDEYHRIVEAGVLGDRRIELLNGELIEVSPETPSHANQNNRVFKYLLFQFDGLADVRSGHPITLSTSEPQPDIILAKLPESRYDDHHPKPDDIYLVIEVSYSTLDYDLRVKKEIYAQAGIEDYWVIDLKNRRLIVFKNPESRTQQTSSYQQRFEFTEGIIYLPEFPHVPISVERLLG